MNSFSDVNSDKHSKKRYFPVESNKSIKKTNTVIMTVIKSVISTDREEVIPFSIEGSCFWKRIS